MFSLSCLVKTMLSDEIKNTLPNWDLVTNRKLLRQKNEVLIFAWGKALAHFSLLTREKAREGGLWELRVYDNFCSTHQHLPTLKIS